ncbi:MAG: 50S ribosomal protein L25/general stress protein Ctc [Candidatus Ancillula sp.]|jgi:large subunit ribosomal protein L25|nr:50S ribosomal protein L25/general stress protein Ctc [Candidatus Ancillula sp.]
MADYSFDIEERTEFGKGFARRARSAGKIPAVIYGGGNDPLHVFLPTHETTRAVRLPNALFELQVAGNKHLALVKDIQRNFVSREIEHVDLFEVKDGLKVDVRVELRVVGETKPGTATSVSFKSIAITVDATKIPRFIELDVNDAAEGTYYRVADIVLPDGITTTLRPDMVVVAVKARAVRKTKQVDVAGGGESDTETSE